MKNTNLPRSQTALSAKGSYPLTIAKEIEKDGIGMGVLSDGSAYLTRGGLARMCGTDESTIRDMAGDWTSERSRPRGKAIAELLSARGFTGESLFCQSK